MLHASTQKLIVKLCELTEAGHIAWTHGEGRTCTFETEGYLVEVQAQPPRLRLLHVDGRELERADETDLASQPSPDGESTFAALIALLAARADRVARGAEFAISRILSSLSAPPKAEPFSYASRTPSRPAAEAVDRPPPPAPHTAPGPPPDPVASDTAIDRVLAVETSLPHAAEPPKPEPEPVIIESETAAIVGEPEAVEEAIPEAVEEPAEPPVPEPAPKPASPPPAAPLQNAFGATQSFARPKSRTATPRATAPKSFSTSPLFFGVNQLPREPARAEPEPPPVPAPAPKPVPPAPPVAEKKPEPAIAGPDIYKPWS
jgi:hypothetical protein